MHPRRLTHVMFGSRFRLSLQHIQLLTGLPFIFYVGISNLKGTIGEDQLLKEGSIKPSPYSHF